MSESAGIFTAGILLGLSAGLSPGPLMTLVITESLKKGLGAGIRIAAAPLITDVPIIALSLLLLASMVHAMAFVGIVALLGGTYIAWMGYANITFQGPAQTLSAPPPRSSLRTGVVANLLNPNPYLFWLTVGGPLILKADHQRAVSAALFLVGFYGCLVGSKVALAIIVDRSRRFLHSRIYVWTIRLLGILLLVFAGFFFGQGFGYLMAW